MRVLVALLALGGTAVAQPGPQTAPPSVPPPYAVPVQLTQEEHDLLMRGEISDGAHVGGGVAALFFGFGTGQAIQGRWSDTGWIFTLGESASLVVFVAGLFRTFDDCVDELGNDRDCDHSDGVPMMAAGAVGMAVFRIWEIVDAFAGPGEHNRKVRELKWRMGVPTRIGWRPYMTQTNDTMSAGLVLRF